MSLVIAFFNSENAIVVSDGRMVIPAKNSYIPIDSTFRKVRRIRSGQLIAYVGVLSCVSRLERLADEFCGTLAELRCAVARIVDEIDPAKYSDRFLDDGAPYGILAVLIIGRDGDGKLRAFHNALQKDGARSVEEYGPSTRLALGFTGKIDDKLAVLDKALASQQVTTPVGIQILSDFIRDIERRFPVEVGGEIFYETITAQPAIVVRSRASHERALAIANGLVKPAHISNQGLGQITQGSALCETAGVVGSSTGGWVVMATAPINVPSGTASIQFTLTETGATGGATPGYIFDDIGFAIYSGSAPASPQVGNGSIGPSQSLTLNSPTTGDSLTVGLYVHWTAAGAYTAAQFALIQNVMQLFTAGSLT